MIVLEFLWALVQFVALEAALLVVTALPLVLVALAGTAGALLGLVLVRRR